jgi:hypothetical protein
MTVAVVAATGLAWAQDAAVVTGAAGATEEKAEKAAYLGITTSSVEETLAKQLGLPRHTGLVVTYVDPQSKAAGKLQAHDILRKFNDQILINPFQFSVLVRLQKSGDEVKLAVVREGKPVDVAVALTEKELPPLSEPWTFPRMRYGGPGGSRWQSSGAWTNLNDFLRQIMPGGQSSSHTHSATPGAGRTRTHFMNMGDGSSAVWTDGTGSSRVSMRQSDGTRSTFTLSENGRTLTLTQKGAGKRLSVTDDDGKSVFDGPVNTDEDRAKVPADLQASLKELDGMVRDADAEMKGARSSTTQPPAQDAN